MSNKTTTPKNTAKSARQPFVRTPISLESVRAIAPTEAKYERMVAVFGLEQVPFDDIEKSVKEHLIKIAEELDKNLNDKAKTMFFNRLVGSFVNAAYGAAKFYGAKHSAAQEIHTRLLNDDRDADRDGVAGFESRAQRAWRFAATVGLQAYALYAAASGAVAAFPEITGDEWKPYSRNAGSLDQRVTGMMAAAFDA